MPGQETVSTNEAELDQFLRSVQRRALVAARLSVSHDDALDCVQSAMFKFIRKYRHKQSDQWRPLFFRILYNCLRDWHRRSKLAEIFSWHAQDSETVAADTPQPDRWLESAAAGQHLVEALRALPLRQQQAFVMRYWEGFDTAATASALGVNPGTVKTHLSRAVHRLRCSMEDHDDNA